VLIEERVSKVEEALAELARLQAEALADIRASMAGIRSSTADIRSSNARTDAALLAMQRQAEQDRQQAGQDRRASAERFRQWDERYEKDRKDFNKRLAEISDSMGTLIEDMVAPGGFQLARAIFVTEDADTCAIRIKRRHPALAGEMMEIDLLAIGATKILVIEVKRRVDAAKAAEYRQNLARLPEFFPELAGKAVYPAVASVYLEPSVIAFLNREKLYGIALGDEIMQVVNLGQF
jgi:hypothetical protein